VNDTDPTVPYDAIRDDLRNTPDGPDVPPSPDDAAGDVLLSHLPAPADGSRRRTDLRASDAVRRRAPRTAA
jgi:hypothetical protein